MTQLSNGYLIDLGMAVVAWDDMSDMKLWQRDNISHALGLILHDIKFRTSPETSSFLRYAAVQAFDGNALRTKPLIRPQSSCLQVLNNRPFNQRLEAAVCSQMSCNNAL